MKVTVAIDSFKGSLSSVSAGEAVSSAIKEIYPKADVHICPLADGGEGTVDAIVCATGGKKESITVCGPLGGKVAAVYGIVPKKATAVIEMASAAGITLVAESDRNPLNATTYGVGEIIKDAIQKGIRNFIIGIGGSATNDGGVGMLQALGFEFLNINDEQIPLGAKGLEKIAKIKTENAVKELAKCTFCVACDVTNPLCGPNGCSNVFAKQKGATAQMIQDMDTWLSSYASLTKEILPHADANAPGAGAAGGMGFALMSYLNATLKSGIDLVIEQTGLEEYIKNSDIVVTGEGRLDSQTSMGKAPFGVAGLAKKHNKIVVAFAGSVADDMAMCNKNTIDAFFSVLREPCSLEEAMDEKTAYNNLKETARQVFSLIKNIK